MELHTLGVDGGYTQQDVNEVARALTGWTINRQRGEFVFRPRFTTPARRRCSATSSLPVVDEDGDDVLDIVARDPQTAHFIASSWRAFRERRAAAALVDRARACSARPMAISAKWCARS